MIKDLEEPELDVSLDDPELDMRRLRTLYPFQPQKSLLQLLL
jgi:hypothetical protein